jgi:hypothetical protein
MDAPPPRRVGALARAMRGHRGTIVGLVVLLALFLLPLRGLLRSQGPPMEEGFMLTFPQRVLRGELPNVDFLHLYGPGSVWVLAGFFKVFGDALTTERTVGLLQMMGVVFGVFMLARHWGHTLATFAGLITLIIIVPPLGLVALAWVGAVGLGVWALWFGLEARRLLPHDPVKARRRAVVSGLLAGIALLYRPDLVMAMTGGLVVAVWGAREVRLRRPMLVGTAVGLAPYLVHLATAGVGAAFRGMVLDPVIYLRGGRRLPIPPNPYHLDGFLQRSGDLYPMHWPVPALTTAAELTAWFFLLPLAAVLLVFLGARLVRREPESIRARVLLAVGVFCIGVLPQGVQRTDSAHFAWASCVSLGFLPVALYELFGRHRRLGARARQLTAGVGIVVLLVLLIPHFFGRSYLDYAYQTFGARRLSYRVHYNGRTFYYGRKDVQRALQKLLPDIARVSKPGDRLLVGPADLRKTPYSEAYIYYFFPELRPGTYYIEMDPGVANREGSRLADDVASSDVLVLDTIWDVWDEPNDSRKVGSDRPNQVLHRLFKQRPGDYGGLYELWVRK